MQDAVFSALFVIEYKLQRHAGFAWPLGVRGLWAIANQVTRVGGRGVVMGHAANGSGKGGTRASVRQTQSTDYTFALFEGNRLWA